MSAYLSSISSILTSTTSKYNNLRRTLLSDQSDGDTEDDSHISRVLRAYYVEKGRPFPQWLPPDPKSPQAASSSSFLQSRNQAPPAAGGRRGGGLSDLWETPSQSQNQQPTSLRSRNDGSRASATGGGRPYNTSSDRMQPGGARPMMSSRDASFRTASTGGRSMEELTPLRSASSTGSAQDRLKARLGAARTSNQGGA